MMGAFLGTRVSQQSFNGRSTSAKSALIIAAVNSWSQRAVTSMREF